MKLHLLFPFLFSIISCTHGKLDDQTIHEEVQHFIHDTSYAYFPPQGFISNEEVAVRVAEPVLFAIYGEDNIRDQKPYQVNLIDSLWVINGTLPIYKDGGCFFIVINKKDGRILGVTHGK